MRLSKIFFVTGLLVMVSSPALSSERQQGLPVHVVPGSFWEQAGFKEGDVIVQINDIKIEKNFKTVNAVQGLKSQKNAVFKVIRNGKEIDLEVSVGE